MKIHKYIMYVFAFLILCSISRGVPVINNIPIALYKAVIISISAIYVIKSFKEHIPVFAWCLFLLIILITTYFCFADINPYNTTTFSNTIAALLPFFPIFYYAKKNFISETNLSIFTFAAILIILISFNNSTQIALNELAYETTNITNNYGYFFAIYIPFIFFRKRTIVQILILLLCIVGSIMAAKRGVAVSTAGCTVLYLFYYYKHGKKGSVAMQVLFLVSLCAGVYYLYNYILGNEAFMLRVASTQDGNMSGRDHIASQLFHIISLQEDAYLIYGNGYAAVHDMIGIEAHNDWLEIIVDYGIIGLIIYLTMLLSLIRFTIRCADTKLKYALFASIFIWLGKSFFSMSFNNYNSILLIMVFGYIFGTYATKQQFSYENNRLN